ncbi:MAG: tetratricopeptide repeat protein [Terracidiphilus sp.]
MRWIDHRRRLPVLAAIAVLVAFSDSARPAEAATVQLPAAQQTTAQPSATQAATPQTAPAQPPAARGKSTTATVPLPPLTPEQLGDTLMAHQRYQAAIEAYKQGPRDSATLWNKMGIAYQLMFNLDEATRCYQKSLKLEPKNSVVLNNLGTVYDSQKQYPNAERMYRKAIKYDSKSALIYKNLGTNLLTQHKYKRGWEDYKVALTLDPDVFGHSTSPRVENPASVEDRGAMNFYMAKGCIRAGMKDQAIEYLRMALNEGFTSTKKIMADSEFAGLRGIPAFEQLIASQSAQ